MNVEGGGCTKDKQKGVDALVVCIYLNSKD